MSEFARPAAGPELEMTDWNEGGKRLNWPIDRFKQNREIVKKYSSFS
jgi:hypothetical protein